MAKVKRNILMGGISGALGSSLVFRQMRDGRTILAVMPDFSTRKFSKSQLAHQSRFQQAAAYAREAAKANPVYIALSKTTMKTAYNIALSDWFNPPVIQGIKRQQGRILVMATDNIQVVKVVVMVIDGQGKILDQGPAVSQDGRTWEYSTTAMGGVRAEAWDFAGNATTREYGIRSG